MRQETDPELQTDDPAEAAARLGLLGQLALLWEYARTHPWQQTARFLHSKESPFIVQFAKYGLCGAVAFLTHNGVAYWLSLRVFPAIDGLPQEELARNQSYANLVALFVANIIAYLSNAFWVFTGGRHHRVVEFLIFTAVNVVSGVAGIMAGPFLRAHLGTSWWLAQASLVLTSVLVNFVCRKFFVFQK